MLASSSDIDECMEEIHDCEQICNNVNGSYTCSCNPGYIIDVDLRSCNGKKNYKSKIPYSRKFLKDPILAVYCG